MCLEYIKEVPIRYHTPIPASFPTSDAPLEFSLWDNFQLLHNALYFMNSPKITTIQSSPQFQEQKKSHDKEAGASS